MFAKTNAKNKGSETIETVDPTFRYDKYNAL